MTYRTDEHGAVVHCERCAMFPATRELELPGGAVLVCAECAGRHARALERGAVIERSKRLAEAARAARIADREGVIG